MTTPEQIDFSIIREFSQRGDQKVIMKKMKLGKQAVSDALCERSRNWDVVIEQMNICIDRAARVTRKYEELIRYKKTILEQQKELQQIGI